MRVGTSRISRAAAAVCSLPLAICILPFPGSAWGGGGPENLFLLVNANSDSSKTIANHYIELRRIPPQNVLYVDWKGPTTRCQGSVFRSRILLPAIDALEQRQLNAQIDYLIYSADFPWAVDLQSIYPQEQFPRQFAGIASITGATYLAPFVIEGNPAIVMPNVNWYVPGPHDPNLVECQQLSSVPTRGFRSRYLWDSDGKRTSDPKRGQRYLLSTMLGVTQGRGNTVDEVLTYLRRSASADGTRPPGTIYFMTNNNPRSTPRHGCFASVAAEINRHGVRATVLKGTIPTGAADVMGLMAGVASFDWATSGSRILPGAICDHLTSYGGDLSANASQTPLSEFLRHGAAGACGTVREPFNIQAKFPLPSVQLHYVRGCSLAEAFYQSISGPYQLLIVGDPLCRPWAIIPKVTLPGIEPEQVVRGSLEIRPSGTTSGGHRIGVYEIFVDGRLRARISPGQSLSLDTTKLSDGYHEIRAVGVHAGSVESQGRAIIPVTVKNHEATLEFSLVPTSRVAPEGTLVAKVRQPGAEAIEIRQNSRSVGHVQGEAGEVEIAAATLGRGPTTLQAVSEGPLPVVSAPVRVVVE